MMAQTVIRAEVDGAARLVRSDAPLAGLQARAGGMVEGPLVIPQLARLARLAMRLDTPISRPIIAGDDDCDISMWVRVTPREEGAILEIVDWVETERAARIYRSDAVASKPRLTLDTVLVPQKNWDWACNPQLRLTELALSNGAFDGGLDRWIGHSLAEVFKLQPDSKGQFPLLLALAGQQAFSGQGALAALDDDRMIELQAAPFYDDAGQFLGYRGTAGGFLAVSPGGDGEELVLTDVAPERIEDSGDDHSDLMGMGPRTGDFSRRIDGALRRPLGRIIANAETISGKLEGPIRQDYAAYAADIAEAGRHLMGLIDDLADLQAIERPDFKPAKEAVDLADIGRRAAGLLTMKARDRGITIDAPDTDETVMATGEFRRALQILINLVGNAIRYSPEGSMIWIRAENDNGHAMVTVADQGHGIAADQQEKIFQKFERLGRDDQGGSGLGLYIARRLARAMDGDLVIDSAPGQGARFSLILPKRA